MSDRSLKKTLGADHFIWQCLDQFGKPTSEKASDDFLTKLPHKTDIFCSSAGCNYVPPLVHTVGKAIWVGTEGVLYSATEAIDRTIGLHNVRKS